MQITTIQTSSCYVHRYTLMDNQYCFKCNEKEEKCKFIYKELIYVCKLCFSRLPSGHDLCMNCLQCSFCGKFNRLYGYCKFCQNIFSPLAIETIYKIDALMIFNYFFADSFEWLQKNNHTKIFEKNILKIFFSYF